jgi:hypothetical protein
VSSRRQSGAKAAADQVARAADGQELAQALHDPEHERLEAVH